MTYIYHYKSPVGDMTAFSNGLPLTALHFNGQKYASRMIKGDYEEKMLPVFEQTKQWLDLYFDKKIPDFMPQIFLTGSQFQLEVWDILAKIPYGQTITYGDIAKQIARQRKIECMSPQAAGQAVGHNPAAILIPCHRVVGTGGKLTGYAGGIDKKKALLAIEQEGLAAV